MRYLRLALLPLLIVACDHQPASLAESPQLAIGMGNSGPSANGQATLPLWMYGARQSFSFHARKLEDGTVSGSLEAKSRGQDLEMHGDIDCLVVTGNVAILGGLVTQVRAGPDFPFPIEWFDIGTRFWFKVVDNGEGYDAPPDLFSDIWPQVYEVTVCGEQPFVGIDFDADLFTVEVGNVQVKP